LHTANDYQSWELPGTNDGLSVNNQIRRSHCITQQSYKAGTGASDALWLVRSSNLANFHVTQKILDDRLAYYNRSHCTLVGIDMYLVQRTILRLNIADHKLGYGNLRL
jgi:hypothetical protein